MTPGEQAKYEAWLAQEKHRAAVRERMDREDAAKRAAVEKWAKGK